MFVNAIRVANIFSLAPVPDMTGQTEELEEVEEPKELTTGCCVILITQEPRITCAGIAQLGEQQTEVDGILEVPCSIHGSGIFYSMH